MTDDTLTVYHGHRVDLRPLCREDFLVLYQWRAELEELGIARLRGKTYEEFATRLEQTLQPSITLMGVDKHGGRPAAFLNAYDINLTDGWCFALTYVPPDVRSQRLGGAATVLFWDYLFSQLSIRKLYIDVDEFNSAWLRSNIVSQTGVFTEEGVLRQHLLHKQRYWDLTHYAIYRARWAEARDILLPLFSPRPIGTVPGCKPTQTPAHAVRQPLGVPGASPYPRPERPGNLLDRITGRHSPPGPSRLDLVRAYLSHGREGEVDKILEMCSDDVVYDNPALGEFVGKDAFRGVLTFNHRILTRAGQGGPDPAEIEWAPPQDDDQSVLIQGYGTSPEPLELRWFFDRWDTITCVSIRGPSELRISFLLGSHPPL